MEHGKPLQGKNCVVTGGTRGIGLATARRLVAMGARAVIVGRDLERGLLAQDEIHDSTGVDGAFFMQADLSDEDQVRMLAKAIARRFERLDVLVNNAGAMFGARQLNAQGLEMTFALNHLGAFLLTALLLPRLAAAHAGARIINVSSEAHRRVRLDFDDLQAEKSYNGWLAYRRSKLANLLFTQELARRLEPHYIMASALHPGFVATGIGTRNKVVPPFWWRLATLLAASPEKGAETPAYLASEPEVPLLRRLYFKNCKPARPSAAALDPEAALRLWDESVRLAACDPGI